MGLFENVFSDPNISKQLKELSQKIKSNTEGFMVFDLDLDDALENYNEHEDDTHIETYYPCPTCGWDLEPGDLIHVDKFGNECGCEYCIHTNVVTNDMVTRCKGNGEII